MAAARIHGVDVLPGPLALAGQPRSPYPRLSYDRPAPMRREGVDRLAAAWDSFT